MKTNFIPRALGTISGMRRVLGRRGEWFGMDTDIPSNCWYERVVNITFINYWFAH